MQKHGPSARLIFALLLLLPACRTSGPESFATAFGAPQIIGEGSDFVTVQIDLPSPLPEDTSIQAVALDGSGTPLRKITSVAHRPDGANATRIWVHLFAFDPQRPRSSWESSESLRFIVRVKDKTFAAVDRPVSKVWGSHTGEVTISDLPAPPERIPGKLVLGDYTFLAAGDPREPDGYFVEGIATGKGGEWSSFEVTSDVKGRESQPREKIAFEKGWLEMRTGRTHRMVEGRAPSAPYVEGWWDGKGVFLPDPPKVIGNRG